MSLIIINLNIFSKISLLINKLIHELIEKKLKIIIKLKLKNIVNFLNYFIFFNKNFLMYNKI